MFYNANWTICNKKIVIKFHIIHLHGEPCYFYKKKIDNFFFLMCKYYCWFEFRQHGEFLFVKCFHSDPKWSVLTYFFSSPELKAQVSFSEHLFSVVCPSIRPFVCLLVWKLFTFLSSPEALGQFQPNLAQSIHLYGWIKNNWKKIIQMCKVILLNTL